ncbi:hypothetical protein DERP_002783, partial [Dermatophagoides pteronyssinus]
IDFKHLPIIFKNITELRVRSLRKSTRHAYSPASSGALDARFSSVTRLAASRLTPLRASTLYINQ